MNTNIYLKPKIFEYSNIQIFVLISVPGDLSPDEIFFCVSAMSSETCCCERHIVKKSNCSQISAKSFLQSLVLLDSVFLCLLLLYLFPYWSHQETCFSRVVGDQLLGKNQTKSGNWCLQSGAEKDIEIFGGQPL